MRRFAVTTLLAVLLAAIGLLTSAAPAAAHTGLESSDPADSGVVEGPLSRVVLTFTGTPTAIDDGIAVASGTGDRIDPVAVTQDGLVITAEFDPPLEAGGYALSWVVRSDDTHTIDGTLSFEVTAPTPTTVATPVAPVASDPTSPATTLAPDPAAEDAEAAEAAAADDAAAGSSATAPPPAAPRLDVANESDDGEEVARMGRLVLFPSAVVAIGMLAFAALSYAGRRDELSGLIRIVRWLGVGIAFGALLEVAGMSSVMGGLSGLLDQTHGKAALARLVGGVLIVVGFGAIHATAARSLSSAVIDRPTQDTAGPVRVGHWRPAAVDAAGLAGLTLVLVSFAFDGHSLSRGPRLLHAIAGIVHVGAAAVWAGGLVAMGLVLWHRHRAAVETYAVHMVVRFSVVAMVALAITGAAGLVLALFIEPDITRYVSTEWGRLLLVKLGIVGVAAAIGGYNHVRLLPALEAAPEDGDVVAHARQSVILEATLVVAAAIVTALLVAASTLT